MKHLTLKELPKSERPYEKLELYGAKTLSDAELLAIIIKSGAKGERSVELASRVLNHHSQKSGLVGLNYLTMEELMQIKGIGRVKAIQLLCIAELTKRMAKQKVPEQVTFSNPESIASYYMQDMRCLEYEQAILLLLDSKCHKIKDFIVSQGTVNASIVEPREILVRALQYKAVHMILLHNHPSGDVTPSKEDIILTEKLYQAGELVGVTLLDHIIIGNNVFWSFQQEDMLFAK
ncbi:MAG: DNA repair protein RadC [Lachnospiraceae bacterium]|nr:DNA repair protein RadC [Lachnospiraceae bacterium]